MDFKFDFLAPLTNDADDTLKNFENSKKSAKQKLATQSSRAFLSPSEEFKDAVCVRTPVTPTTGTLLEDEVEELVFCPTPTPSGANNEHLPTFTQTILGDETVIKHITASGQQVDSVGDNTDLVPGVYEGGWKTWECSYLLLDYLYEKYPKWRKGDNVLELGCGSGLPGLYCLLRGASVTFQDYNKDVLQELTMPNARLTCSENVDQLTNCKFFSGDWKHFHAIMVANKCRYDIILTSETIYNCNSYQKLHNIFKDCLSDHGTILVSCKSHYFGVGGGVESFKDFVARQGVFNTKTVLTTNKNLQCSILQLSRRMTEHLES